MLDRGGFLPDLQREKEKVFEIYLHDIENCVYKWYTINKILSNFSFILLILYKHEGSFHKNEMGCGKSKDF